MRPPLLPLHSPLHDYERQAQQVLEAHRRQDPEALALIHRRHPRYRSDEVAWLPRDVAEGEIAAAAFDSNDARLVVARGYDFADWLALAALAAGQPRVEAFLRARGAS